MSDALVTSATKTLFDNGSSYGSKQSSPLGTILFQDDFSSGDFSAGWGHGSQVSVVTGEGRPYCAKIVYDGAGGTAPYTLTINNAQLEAGLEEVYIEYDLKASSYIDCKNLKVHGQVESSPTSKANTTLNPIPAGGLNIQFGDGSQLDNDTQSGITSSTGFYDYTLGGEVEEVLTADNNPLTEILYNDTWQTIRARVKFGANKDGRIEYYVNGNAKLIAHSFSNKNAANLPIDRITFGDYAAAGQTGNLFIANITISGHLRYCKSIKICFFIVFY